MQGASFVYYYVMSKLSDEDVRYVARLSKFTLSDDEIARFKTELASILGYVEKLNSVDTAGVEPTAQVTGLMNVMREDKVEENPVSKEELLKNAPKTDNDDYIVVKKVL